MKNQPLIKLWSPQRLVKYTRFNIYGCFNKSSPEMV